MLPERSSGCEARLFRSHPFADEFLFEKLDMSVDFPFEIGVGATPSKGGGETMKEESDCRHFLRFQQKFVNEACESPPALDLCRQRALSRLGKVVEFGFAIVFRLLPGALDPSPLLQTDQRRIKRPLIQVERVVGNLLEPRCDRICMEGSHRRERLQDYEIEASLQQLNSPLFTWHPSDLCTSSLECQV